MRRVLVLGATGMLGRPLAIELSKTFSVYASSRTGGVLPEPARITWLDKHVDAVTGEGLAELVGAARPDSIVNCIGVTTGSPDAVDPVRSIAVNGVFPHRVAAEARGRGAYFVQVSTDAVFSGRNGPYSEPHQPDPVDLYGRAKLAGEVAGENSLTLRTSFFGASAHGRGVVEWLLSNRTAVVDGYRRYQFTGLSVEVLARAIAQVLRASSPLIGIYHAGGEPLTKFELLDSLARGLGLPVTVRAVDGPSIDRRLDSSRFWTALGTPMPARATMLHELCRHLANRVEESTPR